MGKRTGGLLCVLLLALLPAGCQFIRIEEGERTPLEYTIVKQEEIPEEISKKYSFDNWLSNMLNLPNKIQIPLP